MTAALGRTEYGIGCDSKWFEARPDQSAHHAEMPRPTSGGIETCGLVASYAELLHLVAPCDPSFDVSLTEKPEH